MSIASVSSLAVHSMLSFCQREAHVAPEICRTRSLRIVTVRSIEHAREMKAAQADGKCVLNQAIVADITWPNAGSA